MNRFFVVALMATCFAANAALETIPLTTNESGRVGWEIGLARSNINAMVELIPELDSKIDSASNTMASAVALKQDALPQAGHGELLYSLFGFPAWLDGASSYAIMMHNGTTINWLDKPAGETGSGLLAFGQTNGLHWTGNGYPYSYNGEVAARMKIPASDLSTDYEDGFYGVTVQNGEISFGEIQDPGTITNDWSEVIAAIPVGDPNALSGNLLVTSTAPLTLVVSNGLVYAVLPNGDVVDVTYYLPAYAVTEPTTNYPAGFATFDFEANTTNVSAYAPQIAEWTRQNQPGDTMALTAENLNPTNSLFVFSDDGSEVLPGDIIALDDRQCAVTLPDGLASNSFYLAWPYNSAGFGEPVGINQTELWWIGFDQVSTGDVFYAYGRNLMLGDGGCSLYIAELDRWITSEGGNQYKAHFTMPTDVANGTYTLYVHNGHGGKYGWSKPQTITVVSPIAWNGNTYNFVTDFGGNGSDGLDDQAAFDAMNTALGANPRSIVYFPAGTYHASGRVRFTENSRFYGAGEGATVITSTSSRPANLLIQSYANCQVYDLTIAVGAAVANDKAIYIKSTNQRFENVTFQDLEDRGTPNGFLNTSGAVRLLFKDCTFSTRASLLVNATQLRMDGCTFNGARDINNFITALVLTGSDFSGCTVRNLDNSDTSDGYGWAKGRWIVDTGGCYGMYVGENETIDMAPRSPTPFWTNGVVSSYSEIGATTNAGTLGNCKPCTLDFVDIPDEFHGRGNNSGSWWGAVVILPIDPSPWGDTITGYIKVLDAINNTVTIWIKENQWSKIPSMSETSTVSAVMKDLVDQNSGEQFLIEGARARFTGNPSSTTMTNATFLDASDLLTIGADAKCAFISSGTGMGQSRIIESVIDNGGGSVTINLSESWRVIPDSSSAIVIGKLAMRNVIYDNTFDGTPETTQFGVQTASAGVQPYCGSSDIIIDGNTFSQIRGGVVLFAVDSRSYAADTSKTTFNPIMFTHVSENTFIDCYQSIRISEHSGNLTYQMTANDTTFIGNVFRKNALSGSIFADVDYGCSSVFTNRMCKLNVFDGNTNSATSNAVAETGDIVNQVWVGNVFSGVGGTLHQIAGDHYPILFGNEYSGFSTNYSSSYSSLQIPQGTVLLSDASKTIQLFNVGTTGLTWTSTDNAAWLSVTDSGSIAAESSGTMTLSRSGSTTNGATALVSVVAAGQTNVFTVIYGSELGVQ